jgi:hypothetical protein
MKLKLLDQARVAAPCPAHWDDMKGDDWTRHCSLCRLNVYNLSDMTEDEAEKLLANRQGRLCVRYYLRPDGKVMTKDCPKGLRALRQKAVKKLAFAASLLLTAAGCGKTADKIKEITGLSMLQKLRGAEMGEVAMPSPLSGPTKGP